MKQLLLALLLLTTMAVVISPQKLVNRKMPPMTGQTILGTTIDSSYFKGKVTLINFMYIGCPYCVAELKMLAKLHRKMKDESDFQILSVAPHTAAQLTDFNSSNNSELADLRRDLRLDSITHEILPECAQERARKKASADGETGVGPECNTISKPFKVDGYPVSYLIDRQGIVREAYIGYNVADTSMLTIVQTRVEQLLAQRP